MNKAILFVILLIILSACGQQDKEADGAGNTESIRKEPPELTVISNQDKTIAVLGSHSWSYDNGDGTSTGVTVDSEIPPRTVHLQKNPLTTSLGSEVSLEFAEAPEHISVRIWDNNQQVRSVKVEDASFITDEEGYIIYEIYARWEQGNAHYAVEIKIQ